MLNQEHFPSYLSKLELARLSGLSPATIQRLKDSGAIPFFQPGGKGCRVLFPVDAIERVQRAVVPVSSLTGTDGGRSNSGPQPRWKQQT